MFKFILSQPLRLTAGKMFKSTITPILTKKPKKSIWKRPLTYYLLSFSLGATLGLNVPVYSIIDDYFTTVPTTEEGIAKYKQDLESQLQKIKIVKKLSHDDKYIKIRAWENLQDPDTMTSKTLRTPGGIAIEPLVFINPEDQETITVLHVGKKLVGYPFLIHGGMLLTILDESLKRCSVLSSKNKNLKFNDESTYGAVRGKELTLSYKFPTLANNFIIIKSKCEKIDKNGDVYVKLTVQNLKGKTLVVGEGVFELQKRKKWFFF